MKSRVVTRDRQYIKSLKFASNEAAGLKVDILEALFYSQELAIPYLVCR